MESILKQSPDGTTMEDIEALYKKHEGNTTDILLELWDIQDVIHNKPFDKEKEKWTKVRDICNSYEEEMQNFMKSMKQAKPA